MKNSFFFRKGLLCGAVTAAAIMILALPIWIMPESAAAGSLANCESTSGAPDVTSVQAACNYCRNSSRSSRGVLWIGDANSDVSRVSMSRDVVNEGGTRWVNLALRGQVYSCGQAGTSSNNAWYIWFGEAGHDNANDTPVDFIENNSISSGRSLYRGTGQGQTYTWYSPLGQMTSIRINLNRFIEVATITSERDTDGDGVIDTRVYEYTVSVNRCFSSNGTGKYRNSSECYGDDSKIIIELSGTEECDPTTDPNCCGTCPDDSGDNYFWSKSKVEAVAGGDVPSGIEAKSDEDGSEYVLFSTDQDSVQVKFTHYMGYTNGTTFNTPLHAGHPPNPDTTYGVTQTADSGVSGSGAVSGITFNGNAYGTAETQVQTSTVTVNIQPGETKKVCQKISYSPKNITYSGWTVTHGSWPFTWTDWHYSWSGSGSGASDVCATVTRPTEPGGGGPTAGSGGGSTSGDIMYAGEDSTVGWDVNGPNWDVRRLREWQAVVYRIPVEVSYNSRLHTGTGMPLYGNQPLNVCGWYSNWDYCNVLSDRAGSFGEEGQAHSYGPSARIVVPDTVGYKYCNSFGYRYEYWWYSSTSDWHMDKSYWYVYNAACRTIAKKPSTTIWNGSFMTAGGVKTSLSWRFDTATMGIETSAAGGRSLYGSWSEFMSVVGGSNVGLTSGSIISRGHSQGNDEICDGSINNVALTIRNNSCSELGHSQITNNTTYRTRLATYLENYAGASLNKVSSISSIDTSRTNVVNLDGDVTLSSNIELPSTTYDSIYKIPQVVIFINGNLKITSGVTRIDAWLIVSGDINTCSDFAPGSTQSEAVYRNMSTIYNSGTACSKQLIFNGPVLARSLTARRSYGSDNLVSTPGTFGSNSGYGKWAAGEVFNFRADNFLWAYAQAGRYNSSYTESYSRELAPRY